jgi:hypothetical protein
MNRVEDGRLDVELGDGLGQRPTLGLRDVALGDTEKGDAVDLRQRGQGLQLRERADGAAAHGWPRKLGG